VAAELAGRHVLVTGAGSGIGLATACALSSHGAKVAAVVQSPEQVSLSQQALPNAVVFVQDLLDDKACAALPEKAAQALGGLDALACCAGIFFKKLSDEITLDEWRQTLALNLDATFVLTRAAISQMRKARHGDASVVVISSQIGLVGHARGAAYAASKAGFKISGVITSSIKELIIFTKAAPITTPIANSITLPFVAKALNSDIIFIKMFLIILYKKHVSPFGKCWLVFHKKSFLIFQQ
jgi:NADP-dependent 3-hydroxy acid dehydrogenase YdfG